MSDDTWIMFPVMTKKEFAEFIVAAQEEFDKNNTLSDEFKKKHGGTDGTTKEIVKKITSVVNKNETKTK